MKHFYEVTWVIELDAESPADAARLAREVQLDPTSMAHTFEVRRTDGDPYADPETVDVYPNGETA